MDTQLPSGLKNITNDNRPVVCYPNALDTSSGLWLGDHPLSFSLPLLLTQLAIISTVATGSHSVLRRLGQPKAVSHIVAGALLGISGAARDRSFSNTVFPGRARINLDIIAEFGLLVFLFMIGVKTDLGMIRKSGRKAVAVGLTCTLLPFGLMSTVGYLLRHRMPPDFMAKEFIFQMSATWARTSYTVLSCLLDELNLLNTKVGRLAMSATLLAEFTCTVVSAIDKAVELVLAASNLTLGIASFVSFLGLLGFIVLVARPATLWIVRRTPEGEQIDDGYFLAILMMALASGFVGEVVGHHATTGVFLLGLALPGGHPLGVTLQSRHEALVSGILIPLFMASAGFRSDFFAFSEGTRCGYVVLLVVLGAVGKVAGVLLPCWYCKVPTREAVALTLMMCSKGIFEVYVLNNWMDATMVDTQMYAVIVLSIVAFSAITTPLLKAIYKPSMRYVAHKRRTIQHARRDAELRLLACVHNQEHVAPIVDLLAASYATRQSPICIYVLHLVQLAGQAAAMLAPYEKDRHKGSLHATETDHIVNAFRLFEKDARGSVQVQPFVAISPHNTMHDDVCTVAMDKKVSFVVLPFHKQRAIDGTMEATGALKTLNVNVLSYAPCSVGILVDHGATGGSEFSPGNHLLHHVAVFFIGGPDDREAVAWAMRIAPNPTVGVTVVRFRQPREWREADREEVLDDEILDEFQLRAADGRGVLYREDMVRDGEGTVGVIRAMSSYFSLLVVGRRNGVPSPLTEGLSMWGEYPELGALGNVLASTDFGSNVSTLVVQQHTRVAEDNPADAVFPGGAGFYSPFSHGSRVLPVEIEGTGITPR